MDRIDYKPIRLHAEAQGLLQTLSATKLEDAVEVLRQLSKPGFRYNADNGRMEYSSAFLNNAEQEPQKERLFNA